MQRAKFIRIFENIDKIWRFEPFDCSPSVRGRTQGRGSCARKSSRNGPLSIPSDLCKNFSPRGLAWRAPDRRIRLESTESPPGDSVETAVGGRRRRTKIRRRRSPSGKISQRFFLSPAVHLRSSEAELGLEQIVHGFRIGLAAGRLHHLTDEPTRERGLCLHLLYLVRVARDDLIDHSLDR